MPLDRHMTRQLAQFLRQGFQQITAIPAHLCASAFKECAGGGFRQLDAQAFVRYGHVNVAQYFVELADFANRLPQLLFHTC